MVKMASWEIPEVNGGFVQCTVLSIKDPLSFYCSRPMDPMDPIDPMDIPLTIRSSTLTLGPLGPLGPVARAVVDSGREAPRTNGPRPGSQALFGTLLPFLSQEVSEHVIHISFSTVPDSEFSGPAHFGTLS